MVINTNNYDFKGEYAQSYGVRHNGTISYCSQSPPTYNHSWHVLETAGEPLSQPQPFEERCSCSCWPRCEHYQGMRCPGYLAPPPIPTAGVVPSYSVYHRPHQASQHRVDEDGFVPGPNTYKGVVVNVTGASSVVRPIAPLQETQVQEEESGYGCCQRKSQSTISSAQPETGCWLSWCRPTILLLFLVLLVIVFVLVSAILLYYNCTLTVLHVLYVTFFSMYVFFI